MWNMFPNLPSLPSRLCATSSKTNGCKSSAEKPRINLTKDMVDQMVKSPASTEAHAVRMQVVQAIVENDESFRAFQRDLRNGGVCTNFAAKAMLRDPTFSMKMGQRAIQGENKELKEDSGNSPQNEISSHLMHSKKDAAQKREKETSKDLCIKTASPTQSLHFSNEEHEGVSKSRWVAGYVRGTFPRISLSSLEQVFKAQEQNSKGVQVRENAGQRSSMPCMPRLYHKKQEDASNDEETAIMNSKSVNLHNLTPTAAAAFCTNFSNNKPGGPQRSTSSCSLKNFYPSQLSRASSYSRSTCSATTGSDDTDEPTVLCYNMSPFTPQRSRSIDENLCNMSVIISFNSEESFNSSYADQKLNQSGLLLDWRNLSKAV